MLIDVLSYEIVGVFDGTFLPGGVRIREEDWGVESLGDQFVPCELAAVVGGDGQDVLLEGLEGPDDGLGDAGGVLSVGEPLHEQESRLALGDGEDEVLAVLYEVHLEVTELLPALHAVRPLVNGHPVGDEPDPGPHVALPVLEPVPAVLVERSACVFLSFRIR